ncbi:hypothetical protein [Luteimonas sp. MHLX1A]|uniref:hypothetical protein n=1 Tax=Alterluteimonas muca TaxID=2878684 RepID=UPI001E30B06B|nr:hypothetical protein [Luteimonas sp. MHLX1A]MCD9046839.1 hypothetical protein [Luteimonas sp. MHLX1A]
MSDAMLGSCDDMRGSGETEGSVVADAPAQQLQLAGWTITRDVFGNVFLSGPPHAPGITLLTGSCAPIDHLTLALAEAALKAPPTEVDSSVRDPDALLALRAMASYPLPEDVAPDYVPAADGPAAHCGLISLTAVRAARRALGRLSSTGEPR